MARSPAAPRTAAQLANLEAALDALDGRKPKKKPEPHPWYRPLPADERHGEHLPGAETLAEFLKPTPLDTIVALLLAHEVEPKRGFGDPDKLVLEKLPSGPLLRQAILALRLERADPAIVTRHFELHQQITKLKDEQAQLGEQLPREVTRGW